MIDYLRELLYPLGFLSALAFGARMLVQWLTSEVKGRSVVMPGFWKLSLLGNLLLATHSLVQMQFHVCAIQACNAVISWRNLDLMQLPDQQITFRRTVIILISALATVVGLFALQGYFLMGEGEWFRIPVAPWQTQMHTQASFAWHLFGIAGLILFNSRFWLQWWCAETRHESYLGPAFWWVSLIGELVCLTYFLRIHDSVNFIGPLLALVPYIRNLMLIYKKPLKSYG